MEIKSSLLILFSRCWVLVDHELKVHLYREGVIRTNSDPYDLSDLDAVTSHLSNHCLQKDLSPNYGKYEPGNEMFYDDFNE